MKSVKTVLLLGIATIALTGCEKFGSPMEVLSGERPKPDEFRVVTRKPLNMPGTTNLPEPRLGERSPLEHDPGGDARALLTGDRYERTGGGGAGENALVAAANSKAPSSEVGRSLAEREAEIDANKPYEPPTVMELLYGEEAASADVLDPRAESRRLRADTKTPVDPRERPEVEKPKRKRDGPLDGLGPTLPRSGGPAGS